MDSVGATEPALVSTNLPWRPARVADVVIDDAFWSPRLTINRERTIPFQYAQCKDTGRIDAFNLNWKPGDEPVPHPFWDSDVAKWLEAASYSLATHPDPTLDAQVDDVIALLGSAQQPDGYLNTFFTVVKPGERWTDLRDAHELYCAGHLIEAGVAHFESTGKRSLLDIVSRYADNINMVFGREPGQKRGYCGHEEIELALVKLYRATGEQCYLLLAKYFVDERGTQPFYFDLEAEARGGPGYFERHRSHGPLRTSRQYNQAHLPVREQPEVVGHSVRAMYLYAAMADLAGETADETLLNACRRLWDHMSTKRMYLTGGLGSAALNEGFTSDYDLPNRTAYAETCAAIGLVFWAHRMVQLEGDGLYIDVMEQALYNGVLSGVSLDGTRFFYENPLESDGTVTRKPWFGVACCPPNLARLLASLGQYMYSVQDSAVAVHLYAQSTVQLTLSGRPVTLRQETDYPWSGSIRITLSVAQPTDFALTLRIPGWSRDAVVSVNGRPVDLDGNIISGYARIRRTWTADDTVEMSLPMPVERLYAHPLVSADAGLVALQRGPLVYCFEEVDNPVALHRLSLAPGTLLDTRLEAQLLGGMVVIRGEGGMLDDADWHNALYRRESPVSVPCTVTAIPYHVWDNRTQGKMRVWMRESPPTA